MFQYDNAVLLIDPFLTRPPAWSMFQRVVPNQAQIVSHIPRADVVLVSHGHYDHLLDVPAVLRHTSAAAYGSRNTTLVLQRYAISPDRIFTIESGQTLQLGFCTIDVHPAWHTRTPLDACINGAYRPGELDRKKLPLRLVEYRMDECFTFCLHMGGKRILIGNHPTRADVAFISPYLPPKRLAEFLAAAEPRAIVPVHWDDFTRPLSTNILPMLISWRQGLRGWKPFGRLDPSLFVRRVQKLLPDAEIILPLPMEEIDLNSIF